MVAGRCRSSTGDFIGQGDVQTHVSENGVHGLTENNTRILGGIDQRMQQHTDIATLVKKAAHASQAHRCKNALT
jgi:hypothetical protein